MFWFSDVDKFTYPVLSCICVVVAVVYWSGNLEVHCVVLCDISLMPCLLFFCMSLLVQSHVYLFVRVYDCICLSVHMCFVWVCMCYLIVCMCACLVMCIACARIS